MRWRASVLVVSAAVAVAPWPWAWVDRWWASRWYVTVQRVATPLFARLPWPAVDVLLGALIAWWGLQAVRDLRRTRADGVGLGRAVRAVALRTVVTTAVLHVTFLGLWGLHYRRPPLMTQPAFRAAQVTDDAVRRLTAETVTTIAHLSLAAPDAVEPSDDALAARVLEEAARVGGLGQVVPAPPRYSALDGYFRRVGIAGFTVPWTLETLVAGDVLPVERPMVVAHEWAHLAGLANEGEASYVAWRACRTGTHAEQYSAALLLYLELRASLSREDRRTQDAALSPRARRDMAAMAARDARERSPWLSDAGWRAYDVFLKRNGVPAGTASYADVVRLVLGLTPPA